MGTVLTTEVRLAAKKRAVIHMMLAVIEDLEELQLDEAVQNAEAVIDALRTPFVENREATPRVSQVNT